MKNIWAVSGGKDYDTPEDAIRVAEAKAASKGGEASIVKFHGTQNNPGCMPEIRYRSCAMWCLRNGKWYVWSIHGGTAEQLHEEKPH